jgi:gamma-glutamyl phosphate reductase
MTQSIYDYNHARDQIARAVLAEHRLKAAVEFIEGVACLPTPLGRAAREWLRQHAEGR